MLFDILKWTSTHSKYIFFFIIIKFAKLNCEISFILFTSAFRARCCLKYWRQLKDFTIRILHNFYSLVNKRIRKNPQQLDHICLENPQKILFSHWIILLMYIWRIRVGKSLNLLLFSLTKVAIEKVIDFLFVAIVQLYQFFVTNF